MRRFVLLLMLGLIVFAALGPALEAMECGQSCFGDGPSGECSQELCCSCCVHFKVDPPQGSAALAGVPAAGPVFAQPACRRAWPDPREVLHVPKATLL